MKLPDNVIANIETGDVLLVSSGSWLARQIQRFQKCKYNHAGIFIKIDNELWISEALEHGLALTSITEYMLSKSKLLVLKPKEKINEQKKEYIKNTTLNHSGKYPYEYSNLLIFQPIKFLTGLWIGRKENKADKRFICGEWVCFLYHEAFDIFPEWNKAAPVDLYMSDYFVPEFITE